MKEKVIKFVATVFTTDGNHDRHEYLFEEAPNKVQAMMDERADQCEALETPKGPECRGVAVSYLQHQPCCQNCLDYRSRRYGTRGTTTETSRTQHPPITSRPHATPIPLHVYQQGLMKADF